MTKQQQQQQRSVWCRVSVSLESSQARRTLTTVSPGISLATQDSVLTPTQRGQNNAWQAKNQEVKNIR